MENPREGQPPGYRTQFIGGPFQGTNYPTVSEGEPPETAFNYRLKVFIPTYFLYTAEPHNPDRTDGREEPAGMLAIYEWMK